MLSEELHEMFSRSNVNSNNTQYLLLGVWASQSGGL